MKNSAWYHKLWRKKLEKLPFRGKVGSEWAAMSRLLDEHMPQSPPEEEKRRIIPFALKVASLLLYALPAAAIVCTATYFIAKHTAQKTEIKKYHKVNNNKTEKEQGYTTTHDSVTMAPANRDSLQLNNNGSAVNILPANRFNQSALKGHNYTQPVNTGIVMQNKLNSDAPLINASPKKTSRSPSDFLITKKAALPDTVPKAANNTTGQLKGSQQNKPAGQVSVKPIKSAKNKKSSASPATPQGINYGMHAGYASGHQVNNFFVGAYGVFPISRNFYFNPGINVNVARAISGSYSHNSYFRPDSIAPFSVVDARKVYIVDVPLNLGYRITRVISVTGGPVLSFPIHQTGVSSKVVYVPDQRDTMMHTQAIRSALGKTVITPKFNIGFSAGVNFQINRFNLEAKYQQNFSPYKISSDLGSYKADQKLIQIGIGFQLNKAH